MIYSVLARTMSPSTIENERPPALLPPLDDGERMVRLISEVTGKSPEEVRRTLLAEDLWPGATVAREMRRRGVTPQVASEGLDKLYAESESFLFELTVWNRRQMKLDSRDWVAGYLLRTAPEPLDILCFGDGMGFESLMAARLGHRVTWQDVSKPGAAFAAKLFKESGVEVRLVEDTRPLPDACFDIVLCLDVLEHVEDPSGLAGEIARLLRPGGRTVTRPMFHLVTPFLTTHLDSNRRFSGDVWRTFAPHGLFPVDGKYFYLDTIVFQKPGPTDMPVPERELELRLWSAVTGFLGRRAPWVYGVIDVFDHLIRFTFWRFVTPFKNG